tara:strand:+ start:787 stop:1431 length:645 start_codon:yes stop_codon:yes gene_type:complete
MKTNFLYFRENGYQQYTATDAQTNFTINGDTNWDLDVTADTEVKVEVTFLEAQTTKCGSAYSGGAVDAGETVTVNDTGKSISTNDIVIANQGADGTNGITISAGDVVTISLIPVEGTEACFRADKILAVNSTSDTVTVLKFKASNGGAADDTVTLTHSDNDGAEFKKIADYVYQACNANITERGGVVTAWDKQNNVVGKGLSDAGVTKMLLAIA